MANPLRDQDRIYKRIEEECLRIDPEVWALINHHLRNDLSYICTWIGFMRMTPKWILREASVLMNRPYTESGEPGSPPPVLLQTLEGTLQRVESINEFLKDLRERTIDKESPE